MTTSQRNSLIVAAMIAIAAVPQLLRAEDKPAGAKAAALIAVLRSDAATFDKARACQQLADLGDKQAVPELAGLLGDEKLAAYARCGLESIADASAGNALRAALDRLHGKLLAGVVNSLGVRRDVQAVDTLKNLACDPASGVREEALAALGRIATPEAIQVIQQSLNDTSAEVREAAAHACLNAAERLLAQGERLGERKEVIQLLQIVLTTNVPAHVHAAVVYSAILSRQTSLSTQLKANDPALFTAAMRASRRLPGPEVTRALLAALEHLPPARQAVVIVALGKRRDVSALPAVKKAAAAGPREVRLAALAALGPLGDASTAPLLVDAALAADAGLAQAARQGLLLAKADSLDAALLARLNQGDAKARVVLLEILGQRADASTAAAIVKLTDDPADEVRLAAIQALGRIITPGDIQVLMGCLRSAKTVRETAVVQEALRAAYSRVPDPDACVRKLYQGVSAAPLAEQCFMLELIGQIGGREALKIIAAAARDSRPEIQDVASEALGKWMDADAAPVLLELAKGPGDARLRARALRGYLRIARQLDLPTSRRLAMCEEAFQAAQRDEEKRLAGETARIVLAKGANDAQAARAKALIAQVPRKNGPLFDGRTFDGWEGDTKNSFRIEDGAIVGGSLKARIPRNEFLCTKTSYANFVLRAECKLIGPANGGIQIRSERVPNSREVSGYQADMSAEADGGYWGSIYDESRRKRTIAAPDRTLLKKILKPADWNSYEIRCEGPRIRLYLNGVQTVDFTEKDGKIPQSGIIGLQIHAGGPSEVWYRNITIEENP